jgi:hypothetical protein
MRLCRVFGADRSWRYGAPDWAERAGLYERAGFAPGPQEQCVVLARRPHTRCAGVRQLQFADHDALLRLHLQKPWRVERYHIEMSGLLTTPGLTTVVLERAGAAKAKLVICSMRRVGDALKVLQLVKGVPVMVRVFEKSEAEAVERAGGIAVHNAEASADTFMAWLNANERLG